MNICTSGQKIKEWKEIFIVNEEIPAIFILPLTVQNKKK
jgi:hypothetical protein